MLSPLDLEFEIKSHRAGASPPNVPLSLCRVQQLIGPGQRRALLRCLAHMRPSNTLYANTTLHSRTKNAGAFPPPLPYKRPQPTKAQIREEEDGDGDTMHARADTLR